MLLDDYNPLSGRMLTILDQDANLNEILMPQLDSAVVEKAFRTMVLSRVADDKAVILQRQGRMGTYPPNKGQEAASLGPAMTMGDRDWFVWGFRELAGLLWRGLPLEQYYLGWMGNEYGNHYDPDLRITPTSIPVASQYTYAVGLAYASRYQKENTVIFAFTGDGGTSEGDFHESLNAAGVFNLPIVFIVQNNQWAISLPRSEQTASDTIAQKAIAYGIRGIQVDGNDILAMYAASEEAAEVARNGGGPTLIEAYTYRLGNHTTSDDARRYRVEEEAKEWEARDPLNRMLKYVRSREILSEKKIESVWEWAKTLVEEAAHKAETTPPPSLDDVFRHTYESMTSNLKEQFDDMKKREESQ
ncbi:MAG: pyruvate dehydrogenase (acetyl-transferring) E1 component subunit alpha [Euryarchaeota archaeon]|nr:pyruvate dehydrogenase (acetyl-transferring) E1 component subunit alpha [Euryarchaeota archaeon]